MVRLTDSRQETAQRNVQAILDAVEDLLASERLASTSAVAAAAGVSRVTVYAHFPTREALFEAVAERIVERASAAVAGVEIDRGDPMNGLTELITVAWSQIERHRAVARALSDELTPAALTRAHAALLDPITGLVRRGQGTGTFRTDLPPDWLVASYFALMHACAEEVRSGRLDSARAEPILTASLTSLFTGGAR